MFALNFNEIFKLRRLTFHLCGLWQVFQVAVFRSNEWKLFRNVSINFDLINIGQPFGDPNCQNLRQTDDKSLKFSKNFIHFPHELGQSLWAVYFRRLTLFMQIRWWKSTLFGVRSATPPHHPSTAPKTDPCHQATHSFTDRTHNFSPFFQINAECIEKWNLKYYKFALITKWFCC